VFVLAPDERVEIFIKFRDFTGKYLMHCHNLTHEDHAMMARFDAAP
jgi:FtsP/CotA-like multicopper oxidase with cupredoxin domain